jgi:hypothetical protein
MNLTPMSPMPVLNLILGRMTVRSEPTMTPNHLKSKA